MAGARKNPSKSIKRTDNDPPQQPTGGLTLTDTREFDWHRPVHLVRSLLPFMRFRPGMSLATLAFTLYLTHKAVFHLNETHFEKLLDRGRPWAFAIHAGTALVAALLLHCAIEKPFLRLRERLTIRHD